MAVHVPTPTTSSSQLVPSTRVLLWSAPRCLSTVFERSIRELKTVKVLHEPHSHAFYYGPERKRDDNVTTYPDKMNSTATFEAADDKLLADYDGFDAVFAKNHAYYVKGRFSNYTQGSFRSYKHTFLIRHPLKATLSQYKCCEGANVKFSETAAIPLQYEMFKAVQEVDPTPLVIDADDLLQDPKGMMQLYCSATGLPFHESMLTWKSGEVPPIWLETIAPEVWYGGVINSSGFVRKPKTPAPDFELLSEFPEVVRKTVEDAMPCYEAMYSVRLVCT